jgi:hypothetical protein
MMLNLANLLPSDWVAVQRDIEQRDAQRDILADTLERLLAVGADDSVVEALMLTIDAVDAVEIRQRSTDADAEQSDAVDEIPEPDDSDRGIRQRVIANLRAEGYVGAGYDVLVTARHKDLAEDEYLRADNDLRGKLVRTAYQSFYDARKLWFCSQRELRKYASDELLGWFDQYGRLTRAQLADNLMGRRHYSGSGYHLA